MKKYNQTLVAALLATTLASCLNYDMPGDNYKYTESNITNVTRRGNPDEINYKNEYSIDEVKAALNEINPHLLAAAGAHFGLRGGSYGNPPEPSAFQYLYNLCIDIYGGYLACPHSAYESGMFVIPTSYYIEQKCYGGSMEMFQKHTAKPLVPFMNHEAIDKLPELKAMALLLFDYGAMDMVNTYGPMPFTEIKTNKQNYPFTYESVRDIYYRTAENLDLIAECFAHYATKPAAYRQLVGAAMRTMVQCFDESESGNFVDNLDGPMRFANSFKLRLAIHLTKVEPETARQWAEQAVSRGVIEKTKQEVAFWPNKIGFTNPLEQMSQWGDTRLSAAFECLLRQYNHPYLQTAFTFNTCDIHDKDGKVVIPKDNRVLGILAGSEVGFTQSSAENDYVGFSMIKNVEKAPLYLMKLSEVCFLRAEGAVRGWEMGGDAKTFYENGILSGNFAAREGGKNDPTVSLYDEAMLAYMQQTEAIPYTYIDPKGVFPAMESEIKVGVRWNEADEANTKLEKIATQKYIAMYPESFEAWTELRRTGYPRLLPVQNVADADGSLFPGDIIRRLPFPSRVEPAVMIDIENSGLKALGGEDLVGTRLWWDVKE